MSAPSTIGVGVLGYGFMGRAHAHGYLTMRHMAPLALLTQNLRAIAGRDERAVSQAAEHLRFGRAVTWRHVAAHDVVHGAPSTTGSSPRSVSRGRCSKPTKSGRFTTFARPTSALLASMSWIVIVHFDITGAMHRNAAKPSSQRFREPAPEPQGER